MSGLVLCVHCERELPADEMEKRYLPTDLWLVCAPCAKQRHKVDHDAMRAERQDWQPTVTSDTYAA